MELDTHSSVEVMPDESGEEGQTEDEEVVGAIVCIVCTCDLPSRFSLSLFLPSPSVSQTLL